jgi:Zn-dependent peptidase ImmA (M78 family)
MFINEREPSVRQRFSLLHELKHVIDFDDADTLHARLGIGNIERQSAQIELICNEFAAYVLMPTGLVKRVWFSVRDVEAAALHLNVSPEAMCTRLVRLGLLDRPQAKTSSYFRTTGLTPSPCLAPCA